MCAKTMKAPGYPLAGSSREALAAIHHLEDAVQAAENEALRKLVEVKALQLAEETPPAEA